MGIFDFFSNKKKEREQQEQLRMKQEAERKRQEQQRLQQEQAKRNTTTASNASSLKVLVDKCVELESKGKITELQNCLFQLYNQFNKPGAGKKLISYPEKDNLSAQKDDGIISCSSSTTANLIEQFIHILVG